MLPSDVPLGSFFRLVFTLGVTAASSALQGHQWTLKDMRSDMTEQTQAPAPNQPKKSWYKRWWGIALIALGAIFVLTTVFSGGGSSTTADSAPAASDPADTSEPIESTEPTTEPAVAEPTEEVNTETGIGVPVRDGKFEFTVESIQPGVPAVGDEFLNQTAQGSYTLVTLKVTNIGDEPQTFSDSNVEGFDSQGRELAPDTTAGIYANPQGEGFLNDINPGNSSTAIVVFDLPPGETLTSLRVKDSLFSGGATINLT